MKYNFYKSIVKYFIATITLLFIILMLVSCGDNVVKLNDKEDPFIVTHIKSWSSDTHVIYYNDRVGSNYARITLPKRMFNIGDTIIISKHCNKHKP